VTKKIQSNDNRRRFLKLIGGGAIVVPLFGLDGCSKQEPSAPSAAPEPTAAASAPDTAPAPPASSAADAPAPEPAPAATPAAPAAATSALPHLAESDPVAKALGYHQDASTVDGAKYPQHVAGQACHKCVQFRGETGAAWGPCNIFSANLVNANGWCTAFAAKA
jgi:pyruvate/2-oxoglutarate dehydrogenase complex dihydrolipoamide acyltransferase (E2) component